MYNYERKKNFFSLHRVYRVLTMMLLPNDIRAKVWGTTWVGSAPHVSENSIVCKLPAKGHGSANGVNFRATPPAAFPAKECTLTYDVFVPSDFEFVRGGKLPGFYMGSPGSGGGNYLIDGASCRVMWRSGGALVAYLYPAEDLGKHNGKASSPLITKQGRGFLDHAKATGRTGIDLFESSGLKLKKGQWNSIGLTVKMNSQGEANGLVAIECNGKSASFPRMRWAQKALKIDGIAFATWYGGSDKSWAPKKDQKLIFKDFEVTKG